MRWRSYSLKSTRAMPQEFVLNIPTDMQSFESFEDRLSALNLLSRPPAEYVVGAIREIHVNPLGQIDFSGLLGNYDDDPNGATRANITKQLVHQHLVALGIDFDPQNIRVFDGAAEANPGLTPVDLSNISFIVNSIMEENAATDPQILLLQEIQKDVDAILSGETESIFPSVDSSVNRLFAGFLPEDRDLASRLSGDTMRIANRTVGVQGLRNAVDHLKSAIGKHPLGTVERATKLFITHHPFAREHLVLMPLERRLSGPHSPMP
jgi:hypothetical protein